MDPLLQSAGSTQPFLFNVTEASWEGNQIVETLDDFISALENVIASEGVCPMDLHFLVNLVEEDDCSEFSDLAVLAVNNVVQSTGLESDTDEVEELVSPLQYVSINNRLRSVFIVCHLLEVAGNVETVGFSTSLRLHRDLRCTCSSASTQTQIPHFSILLFHM